MIDVAVHGETVTFTVEGLHKLWALKSRLEIPRAHIKGVRRDADAAAHPEGMRLPGTYVPGLITAGTFRVHGQRIFWDVMDPERALVIDLDDEDYTQLVIEVADPDAVIALLGAV